jgi:hypothetical protein
VDLIPDGCPGPGVFFLSINSWLTNNTIDEMKYMMVLYMQTVWQ